MRPPAGADGTQERNLRQQGAGYDSSVLQANLRESWWIGDVEVPTRVVTKKEIKSGEVSIGTKVRLRDVNANKTVEYHIVGSAEANPAENKLSNESPVGRAIMGRKKGETVEVAAPRGKMKFKIMDIKAA